MPLGFNQANNIKNVTLDVRDDLVYYNEKSYPAGYFAAEVLNVSYEQQFLLTGEANNVTTLYQTFLFGDESLRKKTLPVFLDAAVTLRKHLGAVVPFNLISDDLDVRMINMLLSEDFLHYLDDNEEYLSFFCSFFNSLFRTPFAISNFALIITEFTDKYLSALKKRDENHFVVAAHDFFNNEYVIMTIKDTEKIGAAPFTSSPALRSAVIFARNPKRDQEMMFVTRIFFDSYMDFFVYDLINGMSHGHAPSKCQCCGRYFLTTTGHSPKYCDGMAPQNPTMTCRQYGARQGQKEDNPDHPIYRLFSTRTNTIRKHAERKKIDTDTRAAALELAREYRDRALMDREYFLNGYAGDMELENIYAEAKKRLS